MVVALLALFVALGSGVYAAATLNGHKIKKGSEPGNRLVDDSVTGQQVDESTLGVVAHAANADNAANAADTAKLGGRDPAAYQGYCGAGAIKGSVVVDDPTPITASYTTVPGFNCAGGAVQIRSDQAGVFYVRFVGLSNSGSCVGSGYVAGTTEVSVNCQHLNDPLDGLPAFAVVVNVNDGPADAPFTLLAF
jgi:hypothetical protein